MFPLTYTVQTLGLIKPGDDVGYTRLEGLQGSERKKNEHIGVGRAV